MEKLTTTEKKYFIARVKDILGERRPEKLSNKVFVKFGYVELVNEYAMEKIHVKNGDYTILDNGKTIKLTFPSIAKFKKEQEKIYNEWKKAHKETELALIDKIMLGDKAAVVDFINAV